MVLRWSNVAVCREGWLNQLDGIAKLLELGDGADGFCGGWW